MKIVIIASMAHKEFKSAIYLKEFLFSELAPEISEIIIVRNQKYSLLKRIKEIKKNKSVLSIIKNNILGLNQKPSFKEIILSFIDHLYCSIQSFILKFYSNYWNFKYSIEDRRFIRMKRIIRYLNEKLIPYTIVDKLNSNETETILKNNMPDFIVLAGTGIVKQNIIEKASKAVLNCHSSILPGFRGINSEYFALLENRTELLGHTVHQVTEKIDGGVIYLKKRINYDKKIDNQFSLRYKNIYEGVRSLIDVINNFDQITPVENNILESVYRSKSSFLETYKLMKRLNEK